MQRGAFAPGPEVRVFIRPAIKLQSRPGNGPVLETTPTINWVTGRSAFSCPSHVDAGRRSDERYILRPVAEEQLQPDRLGYGVTIAPARESSVSSWVAGLLR